MSQTVVIPPPGAEQDANYDGAIAAFKTHVVVLENDSRREMVVILKSHEKEPFHNHA